MTDYPSIKPEDVREGDVVRARFDAAQWPATIEGVVHYSLTNVEDYRLYVGGYVVSGATDLRLVSRPTPPKPPLRVGDWVRDLSGSEGQVTSINAGITLIRYNNGTRGGTLHVCARVEPPVGWPVGVPTIDAPTVWYFKSTSSGKYVWCGDVEIDFSWSELVAAGGVPALAVTR